MNEGQTKLNALSTFADHRGVLKKILMRKPAGEIYLLYSNPQSVRGNHYHRETREYFVVVTGRASFVLRDVQTGREEKLTVSAEQDLLVRVEPGVAHAIKNESEELLIVLAIASREYDLNDTFPMQLLE